MAEASYTASGNDPVHPSRFGFLHRRDTPQFTSVEFTKTGFHDTLGSQKEMSVINVGQLSILEKITRWVLGQLFVSLEVIPMAGANQQYRWELGSGCMKFTRNVLETTFNCRNFLDLSKMSAKSRRDEQLIKDLNNSMLVVQQKVLNALSESSMVPHLLDLLLVDMVVFTNSDAASDAPKEGARNDGNSPDVSVGFTNRSCFATSTGMLMNGSTDTSVDTDQPFHGLSASDLVERYLFCCAWNNKQHTTSSMNLAQSFSGPDAKGEWDAAMQSTYSVWSNSDFGRNDRIVCEALETLLTLINISIEDDQIQPNCNYLKEHLFTQTTAVNSHNRLLCTPLMSGPGKSVAVLSSDLLKSLYHYITWDQVAVTAKVNITGGIQKNTKSCVVSILAANVMKKLCLFWEKHERVYLNDKSKTGDVIKRHQTYLSSYLRTRSAPSVSAMPGTTTADKDAGKGEGLMAKQLAVSGGLVNAGQVQSLSLDKTLVRHILSVIASPACSLELRNALLGLTCVGVRTQSSVFLSLEEKDVPGKNFIARCVSILEECVLHFQAGTKDDQPLNKRSGSKNNATSSTSSPPRDYDYVEQAIPLMWGAIHLLGEIVNTLFVDYEHLQRVWYLLIQVQCRVADACRQEMLYQSNRPDDRHKKEYFFYLINIVKEIYFLAYTGITKVSQTIEQMKWRKMQASTGTGKKDEAETFDPKTIYASKSFEGLRLLLATLLSDEYSLWLVDVGADEALNVQKENKMNVTMADGLRPEEKLCTNRSIFVPSFEYQQCRDSVMAYCSRLGIKETLYAPLFWDAASCTPKPPKPLIASYEGRKVDIRDAPANAERVVEIFSRDYGIVSDVNVDEKYLVEGCSYRRMLNNDVSEDLWDLTNSNFKSNLASMPSSADGRNSLGINVTGAALMGTTTTSWASDLTNPTLRKMQNQINYSRHPMQADENALPGTTSASTYNSRMQRHISDMSVVRSENLYRFMDTFDAFERRRLLGKVKQNKAAWRSMQSGLVSRYDFLSQARTNLSKTMGVLSCYFSRNDAHRVFRTEGSMGVTKTPEELQHYLFQEVDRFTILSNTVNVQHEMAAMFLQLVLGVCQFSCEGQSANNATLEPESVACVNDLISPILPRLIPFVSLLLYERIHFPEDADEDIWTGGQDHEYATRLLEQRDE